MGNVLIRRPPRIDSREIRKSLSFACPPNRMKTDAHRTQAAQSFRLVAVETFRGDTSRNIHRGFLYRDRIRRSTQEVACSFRLQIVIDRRRTVCHLLVPIYQLK